MDFRINQEQLEGLKKASRRDEEGLASFKLIENKENKEHFIFRVVCERYTISKEFKGAFYTKKMKNENKSIPNNNKNAI